MNKILCLLSFLFVCSNNAISCDFDCTLQRHLDSIQDRDFKRFESTLTQGKRLTFILPNGTFIHDTEQYKQLLKAWFEEDGWTFQYKVIAVEKSAEMGMALLDVSYDEKERNGKPYHLDHYLSLVFKKEKGDWRLVHDQNTKFIKDTKKVEG